MNHCFNIRSASSRASIGGLCAVLLILAQPALTRAQDVERPDVHAEFMPGVFPYTPEAVELLSSELTLLFMSALDRGWSIDKFIDETESDEIEVLMLVDDLERANLVRGLNDFDMRPGLLVIREAELEELTPRIEADVGEFVSIIEANWAEVEDFVESLDVARDVSPGQLFYSTVVGGLLTGGMVDALMDDQTLIAGPPRRSSRSEGYYAWLVEGTDGPQLVKRESARVGRYTVISIGTEPEANLRIQIDALRGHGPVLESQDADRWRVFSSVFSRDHLFPYFKSRRSELLELAGGVRSARYSAFAEFAAWYYQRVVTGVTATLVESGRIVAPDSTYQYAVRTGR